MSFLKSPKGSIPLGSVSGAQTFDGAKGNVCTLTATGNITLTLANLRVGETYLLQFTQDGTGGRTLETSGFSVVGYDAEITTISADASSTTVLVFMCVSSNTIAIIGRFDTTVTKLVESPEDTQLQIQSGLDTANDPARLRIFINYGKGEAIGGVTGVLEAGNSDDALQQTYVQSWYEVTPGTPDDAPIFNVDWSSSITHSYSGWAGQDVEVVHDVTDADGQYIIRATGAGSFAIVNLNSATSTFKVTDASDVTLLSITSVKDGNNVRMQLGSTDSLDVLGIYTRTQTTVGAAGAASALPAQPSGYLEVRIQNSSNFVIPYYAKA